MKKFLVVFVIMIAAIVAKSQTKNDLAIDTANSTKTDTSKTSTYSLIESVPEFPGGMSKFFEYIGENLHIPQGQAIKGTIKVDFTIGLKGEVLNPIIKEGVLSKIASEEIIRVFKKSPQWKPAIQNSKPVKLTFTLPVSFSP